MLRIAMKLDRIPTRMLLVLGLQPACGPSVGDEGTTVGDSGDSTRGSTGGMSASSATTPDSGEIDGGPCLAEVGPCLDVGPCLGQEPETTSTTTGGDDTGSTGATSIGPCLDVEPTTGDGSSGGSSDTLGPCLGLAPDEPAAHAPVLARPPAARTQVLERVLSSGRLPPDVADRLGRKR